MSKHLAFVTDAASAAVLRDGGFTVHTGGAAEAALHLAKAPVPEVLLVEVPSAEAAPGLLDQLADVVNPKTRVLVSGKVDAYSFYHWLLGLGIEDYLLQPFDAARLKQVLTKGTQHPNKHAAATPKMRTTIAVIGARGGVGATSIAINLAALIAKEQGANTALLDLDAHFGSVALAMDLEPGRGLREVLEKPDRIDALFLERVMVRPFANLAILSAEEPIHEAVNSHPNTAEVLLATAREKFDVIVTDLRRSMGALTKPVLQTADHVIVVAEPNLINLRDSLRIKDYLVEQLKRPAPLLVTNRGGLLAKAELTKAELTKHYGAAPALQLPYVAEAAAATVRGELWSDDPKARVLSEALRPLAAKLTGHDISTVSASGSKLSQLFKPKK